MASNSEEIQRQSDEILNEGLQHYSAGDYSKAIESLSRSISLFPSFNAFYYRGLAWYNLGDYDKAILDFNEVILLNPNYANAYYTRALVFEYKGEYDRGIDDLNKAIQLKSDFTDAFIVRGNCWYYKFEFDKALEDYSKAISLNSEYAPGYHNRGLTWFGKNEFDKAIEDFNRAINLQPDYADAYLNRGLAYFNKNLYDNAINDYDTAIKLRPDFVLAYNNRGLAWNVKGDEEKALADFGEALKLYPDYALVYRNLGDLYAQKEVFDKAIENYEKAISIDGNFKWLQTVIDNIKAKTGRISEVESPTKGKPEIALYYLLNEANKLPDAEQAAIKERGGTFLQAIDEIINHAFANNNEPVVHYTKLKVIDIIFCSKEEASLRYYNVVYMNDPEEGKVLFECLEDVADEEDETIEKFFNRGRQEEDNNIYLGSFLPASEIKNHEDELVMWRTYGKDELKTEAAGCSLVIKPEFFGKNKRYIFDEMNHRSTTTTGTSKIESSTGGTTTGGTASAEPVGEKERETEALYTVLYYDKRQKAMIGHKAEAIDASMQKLRDATNSFIDLRDKEYQDAEINKVISKIVYRFLSEIRYLFKSADYAFENELRVIQFAAPRIEEKMNRVKVDDNGGQFLPRRLFIESSKPIRPFIKKIILGPKVSNQHQWIYLDAVMKMKGHKGIEVKLSDCKFQ